MLPKEAQWEYACRAGTQTLFVWGNDLVPKEELTKWLCLDFKEGYEARCRCNGYGLYGLFTGEWCQEEYRGNYSPSAPIRHGERVVRGGAAMFWPWQDDEWVWCMPAMRMPESGLFAGRQAGFRLIYDLGP
jgi:formylglycine-generating enzyme required for sulfatase activity